jgi:hypothetical protein
LGSLGGSGLPHRFGVMIGRADGGVIMAAPRIPGFPEGPIVRASGFTVE